MSGPKVTVLLAVRNGEPYLRQAIDSVLAQTFGDFELLVIDDASDDGTAELLAGIADERLRVSRNERNLGQVPSLNLGLELARGEYVARLDHDDVSLPERLARQVAALDAEPGVGVVGCWADVIDGAGRVLGSMRATIPDRAHFVYESLRGNILVLHPAATYRRELALRAGGYDPSFAPSEDKHLWRAFLLAGSDARIVPETLLRYRVHGSQLSQVQSRVQLLNDARSHDLLLDQLAPGTRAGALRRLLADEPDAWRAPPAPGELDALVRGAAAHARLREQDARELERLVRAHVLRVALGGWRHGASDWRKGSEPLVRWGAEGADAAALRRHAMLAAAAPVLAPARRARIATARLARRAAPPAVQRLRPLRALYSRAIGNR